MAGLYNNIPCHCNIFEYILLKETMIYIENFAVYVSKVTVCHFNIKKKMIRSDLAYHLKFLFYI